MPRIAVVGGGIAGLSAATRISRARPDAEVVLLEASPRVGGKLLRAEVGGAWVDVGAEAMLARRPEGVAAAVEAGLESELIQPLTTAALLRNRGRNARLPARTLIGVPADLDAVRAAGVLSAETLERIEAEPAGGPYPPLTDDVSVGDLVSERFGAEVVDRLVDPLLGGVYAGRADAISLDAAIPGLAARLRTDGGSLLRAAAASLPPAAAGSGSGGSGPAGPPKPVFASVAGGLARLPEQLAAGATFSIRRSTAVRRIRRTPDGFELSLGAVPVTELLTADAVVLATPASKASMLLTDLAPVAGAELATVESASMAIVTLAFRGLPTGALPAGSGLLIPVVEGLRVKAMTFSSQKWPGVGAESGVLLMRASLGRIGEEWVLQRADDELVSIVRTELEAITGLATHPVDSHVQRWGGGLPQYPPGHLARIERVRAAVAEVAGLAVCGASYDGVGIPACIASAHIAADRVLATLPPSGQWIYGRR